MFLVAFDVHATDYSSSNFIIRDPAIVDAAGRGTSASFELFTSLGHPGIGESTTTVFTGRAGFLYFPFVSLPVVSATPGDQQIQLSWSASVGALGWVVTSYSVGRTSQIGGPYTYTTLGNILGTTVTSLNNGQTYFFVVRPHDAFGAVIATSTEISSIPFAPVSGGPGAPPGVVPPPSPPAPPVEETGDVSVSGKAYPSAEVTVLIDGFVRGRATADGSGNFSANVSDLPPGDYTLSVYATDEAGRRSALVTVRITVEAGETTTVTGIFIPPTLDASHLSVRPGDPIVFDGQSYPDSFIDLVLTDESGAAGGGEGLRTGRADSRGRFRIEVDTLAYEPSTYGARARARIGSETSGFSGKVFFVVGAKTIPKPEVPELPPTTPDEIRRERIRRGCAPRADLNCDGRVDLIDFSILVFWWEKPLPPAAAAIVDLTDDGKVDLFDFSVLIYFWTG